MPELGRKSITRLHRQLKRAEGGEFNNPPRRGSGHQPRDAKPRVVMLLEDCASGDRAECAILVEVASTETQIVEIVGTPLSGTFTLAFNGQVTEALPYDVTAEEMQAALEGLDGINPGDVIVEIGPSAGVNGFSVYRWLVSFTGQYNAQDVAELVAASSVIGEGDVADVDLEVGVRSLPDVEDTGDTLDVLCATPLPEAVVIPAGAIGVALFVPTFGYCLVTAECGCPDETPEAEY